MSLMDQLTATYGRVYEPLPIVAGRGFPQSFPFLFNGRTYYFSLYVNVAADSLNEQTSFLTLPSTEAFMVVRVEREAAAGGAGRETIFLRKVVPSVEYLVENIALVFETQRVARQNLNGQGEFGSQVTGGIAPRWV
jgi:hypothetical protein